MGVSMICSLVGHRAGADCVHNAGHLFSRCLRCASDLVEQEGSWTSAPKGFRIVWKNAGASAHARGSDPAIETNAQARAPSPEPEIADRRERRDRRRPESQATFRGVDRRKSGADRRSAFGRAVTLLERGDVRITRDTARFGDRAFEISGVRNVEVCTQEGQNSLSWLLYFLLAAITAFQAATDAQPALAAIAGALMIMSVIAWRRRSTPPSYSLVVTTQDAQADVYRSGNWAEVALMRDAVATAMPA
jgi:hypothetical protein